MSRLKMFRKLKIISLLLYVHVCVWEGAHVCPWYTSEYQRTALELVLSILMWILGIKLR